MITIEDIRKYCEVGEDCELEFKDGQGGFPSKEFWRSYSAFANTNGGLIIIGVVEEKKQKKLLTAGLSREQFKAWRKQFWDEANNLSKVSVSLLQESDVIDVPIGEDRWLMVFRIPRADYRIRPVYLNGSWQTGTYKRRHEGDYRCPEDEIRAMLRDANEEGNDGLILEEGYDMSQIDMEALHTYRQHFQNAHRTHILNGKDDVEFLRMLGGCVVDKKTGEVRLTLAGLMMFGLGYPIRQRFPLIRMDYIDMTNLEQGSRYSDRLTYDFDWENNLYNFLQEVARRLSKDLPIPFKLKGMERTDDTPMHELIRESLTNMIIHADFMMNGVLRVEKHEDGYLFSNPGYLKIPVETIYEGGTSRARNPKIQDMLRMVGYGDNIGSGFPTLVETWKKVANSTPVLEERQDLQLVNLRFEGWARNTESNTENTESNTENIESNTELSGKQLEVWEFCHGEPKSSTEIFGELKISKQAKHFDLYITPLLEKGYLVCTKEGGRQIKGQRYMAVDNLMERS